MELPNAMVVRSRAKTSDQLMAEKYEDFRILITALEKYSYDTINTAIEQVLLHQDAYRADRVLGQAEQGEWNLTLRVLNRSGSTRIYRIDRFD